LNSCSESRPRIAVAASRPVGPAQSGLDSRCWADNRRRSLFLLVEAERLEQSTLWRPKVAIQASGRDTLGLRGHVGQAATRRRPIARQHDEGGGKKSVVASTARRRRYARKPPSLSFTSRGSNSHTEPTAGPGRLKGSDGDQTSVIRKIPVGRSTQACRSCGSPDNPNFGLFCNAFTFIAVPFERYIVNRGPQGSGQTAVRNPGRRPPRPRRSCGRKAQHASAHRTTHGSRWCSAYPELEQCYEDGLPRLRPGCSRSSRIEYPTPPTSPTLEATFTPAVPKSFWTQP